MWIWRSLADERRTFERLAELASNHSSPKQFVERRAWAHERAAALRTQRLKDAQRGEASTESSPTLAGRGYPRQSLRTPWRWDGDD